MHLTRKHSPLMRVEKIAMEIGSIFSSIWTFLCFAFVAAINFIAPAKFNIMVVGVLVVCDVLTALIGLFMQCKRNSPTLLEAFKAFYNSWTSARAFDSVPKFLYYGMLVLVSFTVGYCIGDSDKYAKLATGIVAYVEIRSIIENGDKAFGTNMWELVMDYAKRLLPGKK